MEVRPPFDIIQKSMVLARLVLLLISLATLVVCAIAQGSDSNYTSNKADYWYKKGLMLAGAGSYDEAFRAYDKAIQIDPDNAGAWNGEALTLRALSFSRHDLHEYNESLKASDNAAELYDKAIKANPQDANNWYFKGLTLSDKADTIQASDIFNISSNEQERISNLQEAIKAYKNATDINPEFVAAWKNIGDVLYKLRKYNEAIQAYDKAIEIVPNYPLAWNGKGLALNKLGKYDEAVKAYDKAIGIIPKNAEIWYNKGNAFLGNGKYDEAINCYDKAIKLNQAFAEAWHYKGVALDKRGFGVEANAAFDQATELGYNG